MQRIRQRVVMGLGLLMVAALAHPRALIQAEERFTALPVGGVVALQPSSDIAALPDIPASSGVAHWTGQGIRFEGTWTPERAEMVASVLDRYADRLGEDRFLALVRCSVREGSRGVHSDLTIAMAPNAGDASAAEHSWIASWAPHMGQITLYENLFDQAHVEAHYRWRFLSDLHEAQPAPITVQIFAVAHEVGHLLLDGLRQEHVAGGLDAFVLEELYADNLLPDYWAQPFEVPNESLADETALWAFGIRRPAVVRGHLEGTLIPALTGVAGWHTVVQDL